MILPIIRPRRAQVAAQQNVRMISRLFVHDSIWIGIPGSHGTASEEPLALLQAKPGEDDGLRQPRIVPAIPEGIGETHRVGQAESGTIQIQSSGFAIVPRENPGTRPLVWR